MMKKSLLLATVFLGFAACFGEKKEEANTQDACPASTETVQPAPAAEPAAPAESK